MTYFLCECIPMMIFMLCFFGWMDCMVLYKWVHPIDNPPSIINSLICMAMGQEDKFPLYPGAIAVSQVLMLLSFLSVPVMLLPKPLILLMQDRGKAAHGYSQAHMADEEGGKLAHDTHEEFNFGEIMIHQIIETIEFVLGTVS